MKVALEPTGEPRELPASLDLSAYRILQEALTNVRKHARGRARHGRARVGARRSCELAVHDRGPGANGTAPGDGHGLVGMRERVQRPRRRAARRPARRAAASRSTPTLPLP